MAGLILPEGKIGVGEGIGAFLDAELEIDAGVSRFQIRQARGLAGVGVGGAGSGRGGEYRLRAEHERFEIPPALGGPDEVEAGFVDADAIDAEFAAPKGEDADGGDDGLRREHGFDAEGLVFTDGEVVQNEARPGKQADAHARKMDGAAEGAAHQRGDTRLIAAYVDEGWNDDGGGDNHDGEGNPGDPAPPFVMASLRVLGGAGAFRLISSGSGLRFGGGNSVDFGLARHG